MLPQQGSAQRRNTQLSAMPACRWPQLAAHLAARYRRAAAQRSLGAPLPDNAAELLHPCDRRLLCSQAMAEQLLG